MKRIKQIIEALKLTRKDAPGAVIHEAWNNISTYINNALGDGSLSDADHDLVDKLMSAISDIAEESTGVPKAEEPKS